LLELRRKLEQMPRHELEIFYKAIHNACALPAPAADSAADPGVGPGLTAHASRDTPPRRNSATPVQVFPVDLRLIV
jgi:hypothetical protein